MMKGRLSKAERREAAAQLRELCPHVPEQVVLRVLGECSSFDEALERVLAVGAKREEKESGPARDISGAAAEKTKSEGAKEQGGKQEDKKSGTDKNSEKKKKASNTAVPSAWSASPLDAINEASGKSFLLSSFPEASEAEVAACLRVSRGDTELASDLLSSLESFSSPFAFGAEELCAAFPALSPSQAAQELNRHKNDFEAAARSILSFSSQGAEGEEKKNSNSGDAEDVAFLHAMFGKEDPEVLEGLLHETGSLEHAVDFLLSLDVLLMEEAVFVADGGGGGGKPFANSPAPVSDEEAYLANLFPNVAAESRAAALEACEGDLAEACLILSGGGVEMTDRPKRGNAKSRRWQKMESANLLRGARVGPSQRWNGQNAAVKVALTDSENDWQKEHAKAEVEVEVGKLFDTAAHADDTAPQYEEHIPSQRQGGKKNSIFSQTDGEIVAKVALAHQHNRGRFAMLAANAYRAGDAQAAKRFSQQAEKEERLFQLWSARISPTVFGNGAGAARQVDLHGFYVREALHVARSVFVSAKSGAEIRFVTGKDGVGGDSESVFVCQRFAARRTKAGKVIHPGKTIVTTDFARRRFGGR